MYPICLMYGISLTTFYHEFKPTVGKYSSPIGKYTIHTLIRHGMGMVAPPTLKAFLTPFFVVESGFSR